MTTRQAAEIDESLAALGIEYDVSAEEFQYGRAWVEWRDVLELIPSLSFEQLVAYMEHKAEHSAVVPIVKTPGQ